MRQDIGGNWAGHYEQDGSRHGISMRVVQKGQSFVGTMRDEDTLMAGSLSLDDVPNLPLAGGVLPEFLTSLPEDSIVEGEMQGPVVTFLKRYRGTQSTTVRMGEHEMTFEIPDHCVQYRGTLDRDGTRIRGEWTISFEGEGLSQSEGGGFELRQA